MKMQIPWVLSAAVVLLVTGCTAMTAVDDPARAHEPAPPL